MSERSFVALARDPGAHVLVAGGCVPNAEVQRWVDEVDRINAITPADLDRYYRNSLLGRKGGSDLGTGLLELARLSHGPLRAVTFTVPDGTRFIVEATVI